MGFRSLICIGPGRIVVLRGIVVLGRIVILMGIVVLRRVVVLRGIVVLVVW
jgi:hypothetical protein